jgi:ABC-type nitrate/sulfonate/bicarbonate transport system permease component
MSSQPVPYPLRMPEELRDRLTELSRASGRSLNAEIIGILQGAVAGSPLGTTGIDIDSLAEAIADRVAARLKKIAD